tara:strand:+ start:411 stop:551 length:141 start_codon:yes stop_codon:yes gene_type:complete
MFKKPYREERKIQLGILRQLVFPLVFEPPPPDIQHIQEQQLIYRPY